MSKINQTDKIISIISAVSQVTGVSTQDIISRSRKAHIANARQISMWISRWNTEMPLQKIAYLHGCTNHANVIHACNQVEAYRKFDKNYRKITETILTIINS
jgi:chromosomal replication initiator protein